MNKILLHIEGLAALVISIYFYSYVQYSWLLFFILLLAPDISALGYLFNSKVGSVLYNLFHTYSIPIVTIIFGVLSPNHLSLAVGLIWTAHIGMDRMIGYGLKYPTQFKDTHFDNI